MKKIGRISNRSIFCQLRASKQRASCQSFAISYLVGDDSPSVAYAISRKVGNAVTRNLIRRRLREIAQRYGHELAPGFYMVAVRSKAVERTFDELDGDFRSTIERIKRKTNNEGVP